MFAIKSLTGFIDQNATIDNFDIDADTTLSSGATIITADILADCTITLPSLVAGVTNAILGPHSATREVRLRNPTLEDRTVVFNSNDETSPPPVVVIPPNCVAIYTADVDKPVFADTKWRLTGGFLIY